MHENADNGQIEWERLQYFVARVAAAVHENSEVLVTLGSAAVKWNSNCSGCEGNFWSDGNLQEQIDSPGAFLDFYSPHFYGWVVRWFGNFALDRSPESYGIGDRPCMVGENPATGVFEQNSSGVDMLAVPMEEAFLKAYEMGWKGLMVWTSNGVDNLGTLEDCEDGLLNFFQEFPELVNPSITAVPEVPGPSEGFRIYPNPSYGMLYLEKNEPQAVSAALSMTGAGIYEIDIRHLLPGLYLMTYSSGNYCGQVKIIRK
jgi:hypothetical protein